MFQINLTCWLHPFRSSRGSANVTLVLNWHCTAGRVISITHHIEDIPYVISVINAIMKTMIYSAI